MHQSEAIKARGKNQRKETDTVVVGELHCRCFYTHIAAAAAATVAATGGEAKEIKLEITKAEYLMLF